MAFESLVNRYYISIGRDCIRSAGLNVKDRPGIRGMIKPIMENVAEQLSESGLTYDAIVGVPTGGNAWAAELANLTNTPLYGLGKVYGRTFTIIDGQAHVPKGSRLLLVDDTIYTGTTSKYAADALKAAEFEIAGIASPVAIGDVGCNRWKDEGIPVFVAYDSAFVRKYKT